MGNSLAGGAGPDGFGKSELTGPGKKMFKLLCLKSKQESVVRTEGVARIEGVASSDPFDIAGGIIKLYTALKTGLQPYTFGATAKTSGFT